MTPDFSRPITLRQPSRIGFGAGCSAELPAELAARGARKILFVLSRSAAPLAQPLIDACRAQGMVTQSIVGVPAEPTVSDFQRLLAETAALASSSTSSFSPAATSPAGDFDAVVGLGGGSVLDIAKLLAALHGAPGARPTTGNTADAAPSVRAFFGNGLLPPRRVALICLPTTAGAGSEVSPNAILYDEADRLKKAVISPWLVPDAAFVDPALTLSLPPAVTAATGLDALVHCLEAYANRAAHPAVDLYALEGVRLISTHIVRAVRDGSDLAARSAVALGALYGGLCLGPVNTAAVHALAYPLGSEFRLAHGLANALLLPHVVRFNLPAAPERYAALARALGVTAPATDDSSDPTAFAALAALGVEKLFALCAACGIPARLSDVGVPADAIPRMARDALKITRLLKNNPREVTLADAEDIYRQAF